MGDTLITVVAIFLAAILMFVFPLMSVSERADDITQLDIQALTTEFTNNVRMAGKLTNANYQAFSQKLASTGNSYDIGLEIQVLDTNISKKTGGGQVSFTSVGNNSYYSEYTSQILDTLETSNQRILKEGDLISVTVKNTNKTISDMLRNFFYSLGGNDTYQIAASHSGMVVKTGQQ